MNVISLLAHAGEAHDTSSESALHLLETWYIALFVFALGTYVIGTLVYMLTKRSMPKTLLALMVVYLIAGMLTYELSPVISILSILFGFIIALGMTFTALMVPMHGKK